MDGSTPAAQAECAEALEAVMKKALLVGVLAFLVSSAPARAQDEDYSPPSSSEDSSDSSSSSSSDYEARTPDTEYRSSSESESAPTPDSEYSSSSHWANSPDGTGNESNDASDQGMYPDSGGE
jgi:hypothetical protein